MVSSNLILLVSLAMVALVASSPLVERLSKATAAGNHHHRKRNFNSLNPIMDGVDRCILACGECAGDLDLIEDKVSRHTPPNLS